jgi:hypothetical protein
MTAIFSLLRLVAPSLGGGANLRQANIFGAAASVQPSSYYVPGTGGPAVSTSDYYHLDGLYWFRPYDLNGMGTPGQTIAASLGRYFWIASPDHPSSTYGWADGQDFLGGYSNDPGVLPDKLTLLFRYNNSILLSGTEDWRLYQAPFLVYNPDDATYPFYIYCEGNTFGGATRDGGAQRQHEEGLARSTDLVTWVMNGPSHPNTTFNDWSSFQRVVRSGVNAWYSVGLSTNGGALGGFGKWTSTDGRTFTQVSTGLTMSIGSRVFEPSASDEVTISAQKWLYMREDARSADGGMYVTRVAVDASWNVLLSPAPVRISSRYAGSYPGPSYLQSVAAYAEDGVAHIWANHGFPPSSSNQSLIDGATYANGGGLWQQNVDYYTEIVDAAAAAQAAPVGVAASCASGVVTLSWFDALPNQTYRVYRGTSAGTQATLVGDVTGLTATDSPTVGSRYWYKVVTMEGASERGNRVVAVYVSANSALTNKHVNRILADSVTAGTYDVAWIEACVAWLESQSLTNSLLFWPDPAFGTKHTANAISKVYCLGTTRLPRGGDYTPQTPANTTYSATGMNGSVPGWTNAGAGDHGYFGGGRLNNIRRKVEITCVAAYKKPNSNKATFLAMDQFTGMVLYHDSDGAAKFKLYDDATSKTATKAVASHTAANIIAGTFDGTNLTTYVEGVAGTAQTGLNANTDLSANTPLKGVLGTPTNVPVLISGSETSKYVITTESFSFSNNEAQFSASDLIVFEKALTASQVASLTTLLRNRIGA